MNTQHPANLRYFRDQLPTLGSNVYIDPTAAVIGQVQLGSDSSVWPMTAIRGDVNAIYIGARTSIQDGSVLHVSRPTSGNPSGHPLVIGDDVTVGHKAMLHGCHIGNRVLIGIGAIILDGAVIEDDVMVGAGALVTPGKTLASGYLYTGAPARAKRPLNAGEYQLIVQNAANYVALKNEYLG